MYHDYRHPITVSVCGFTMAVTTVLKAIKSKKNFYKLEIDDLKPSVDQNTQSFVTSDGINN
jgi:hypothetical protein